MSWATELYKTYEANCFGKLDDGSPPPISHDIIKMHVEVNLDEKGDFVSTRVLEDDEMMTLIPVTESSSGGRSSGVAPHSLSDSLSYISKDFSTYCSKKKDKDTYQKRHKSYIEALTRWKDSSNSHPKVLAIHNYISSSNIVDDLFKSGIIELDENGFLSQGKVAKTEYAKVMVRFKVYNSSTKRFEGTWEDEDLVASYIAYYNQLLETTNPKELCEISGKKSVITDKHPKGVLRTDYGAKLISANDKAGFTYRGRFVEPEDALTVGYEASQKIHHALKWLINRQGIGLHGGRQYVSWAINGVNLPDPTNPFAQLGSSEESCEEYRILVKDFLNGYRSEFEDYDGINVMGLEAANDGRLSVVYYNQFAAKDFFDRLELWGDTCQWYFGPDSVRTPTFYQIATRAFGYQTGEKITLDDRILREQIQRLMDAMLNSKPVPKDIVRALYEKASTPMAYTSNNRWRVLSTACAVINRNNHLKGEGDDMTLNHNNCNRSYLFGRLLAIYEKAERVTYSNGEDRDTNAIRLQAAFVNHPMQTWKILEDQIRPYFQRLRPGSREYYKNLIGEITCLFEDPENKDWMNQTLDEEYLMGYYLQRRELMVGSHVSTEDSEEE